MRKRKNSKGKENKKKLNRPRKELKRMLKKLRRSKKKWSKNLQKLLLDKRLRLRLNKLFLILSFQKWRRLKNPCQ